MTFLALNIEKSSLTQQKDYLEYQEMVYVEEYNGITEEMAYYQNNNNDKQYDNQIAALESQQEIYDSQKSSIESQIESINAQIESYDKAVQTNIKSECKLTISV